mgnify:CR=1 FL=1
MVGRGQPGRAGRCAGGRGCCDRYNGGGSTSHKILGVLIKTPWLIRTTRGYDGLKLSENIYRGDSLELPTALMFNTYSYSNAEVMALGVKAGVEPLPLWKAIRRGSIGRARAFDKLADQFLANRYDPPGFALESFDVIGGYRTRYRSIGEGDPAPRGAIDPFIGISFKLGPKVDSSGRLPDGKSFGDIRELQTLLAADRPQLLSNLARQWLVYATGRETSFRDRDAIDAMARAADSRRSWTSAKSAGVMSRLNRQRPVPTQLSPSPCALR